MQGRYAANGDYVVYDKVPEENSGIDAGLVEGFSDDLLNPRSSRDGIANDLLPLTYTSN